MKGATHAHLSDAHDVTGVLEFDEGPTSAPVDAARLAIGDAYAGTRTFSETSTSEESRLAVALDGVYSPEPEGRLLFSPNWMPTGWDGTGAGWILDIDNGLLTHNLVLGPGASQTTRWSAAGHPGVQVWVGPVHADTEAPLANPLVIHGQGAVGAIVVRQETEGDRVVRVAGLATASRTREAAASAERKARVAIGRGAGALMAEQRRRWSQRWEHAQVEIDGDPRSEQRMRYSLFRLLCLADHDDELALGARGLTGMGYRGHVFWDTDVFVLPALSSFAPSAARAMIEYRLRRLPAARRLAADLGFEGARFPWESAASGFDVTPRSATAPNGQTIPIRTGELELHVSADICWAIDIYRCWTRSDEVLRAGGADLIADVARYWATQVNEDADGTAHLRGVIGPDEYHEDVDDNAYTNRMVAWNLRRAAALAGEGRLDATSRETARWVDLAERLAKGYVDALGRHEQFAGFDSLEPVLAETVAQPPFPADLLLGRDAVQRSQLIKQADVVMLHALLPGVPPPGSCERDLDYYLPRTSHGSSLSPASHAQVMARAGRPDEALRWFEIALGMDLDDLTRTGAGGLHYATIGGAWQAFLLGFVGVTVDSNGLRVSPNLPQAWRRIRTRFTYSGVAVEIVAGHHEVVVTAEHPVPLCAPGGTARRQSRLTLSRDAGRWTES